MITLDSVSYFNFEITSYCNLHCPQCSRFDVDGFENKDMSLAHLDFDQIIKNLEIPKLTNLKEVLLQGDYGDPLMHPKIFNILDAFRHVEKLQIGTNASLLNKDRWRQLASYKNLKVVFAIDGLKDTNHVYRINANFDKIMANAEAFIAAGGQAIWKFIIFKHNEHQVDQARELANRMGFIDFRTQRSNRNFYDNNTFPVMINGVYQDYDLHIASGISSRQDSKHAMIHNLDRFDQSSSCSWLSQNKMYVDYLGNLIPCCMTSGLMWRKDMSGKLWRKIVGDLDSINLHQHSISQILQSDFYQTKLQDSFDSVKTIHHACFSNCFVSN
jgi:sulfatase maturation enzyme AslB (radical SAM superfamily)